MKDYYVYMLTTKNNTVLYIGVTNDLRRRVYEHKTGVFHGFTQKYRVHKLVYCENCHDIKNAIAREKQLKNWARAKKEALINAANPNWNEIQV